MSAPNRTGSKSPREGGRTTTTSPLDVPGDCRSQPLRTCVEDAVESYLEHLDGHDVSALFDLVMAEVEAPLLKTVLAHANGNQSRAASMLGINRATLRKKLKRYNLV